MTITAEARHGHVTGLAGSTTGQLPIGRYTVDFESRGGATLSLTSPRRRIEPPQDLVDELKRPSKEAEAEDPGERRDYAARLSERVDHLSDVTGKAQGILDLITALLEGRLPDARLLAEESDEGLALLQRLVRTGRFAEAIELGRPLCRLLALTGRIVVLVEALRKVLHAATALADSRTSARALHELGTLHQCIGDRAGARRLLEQARAMRAEIGDQEGLAATEHNLRLLATRQRPIPSFTTTLIVLGGGLLLALLLGLVTTAGGGTSHAGESTARAGNAHPSNQHNPPSQGGASQGTPGATSGTPGATNSPSGILRPSSIDFGSVAVGQTTAPRAAMLSNRGDSALLVRSIVISGPQANEFAKASDGCTGTRLAPGQSCPLALSFTPTAVGSGSAEVIVSDNGDPATEQLTLQGAGVGTPRVVVSPAALNFPAVVVGQTSERAVARLSNDGDAPLSISAVTIGGSDPGDFAVAVNGCTTAIPPGGECQVAFTFGPTATGSRTALVTVTDNSKSGTAPIPLAGEGVTPPEAAVSPSSLNFGPIQNGSTSGAQTVILENPGDAPLDVTSAKIVGANAGDFSVVPGHDGCSDTPVAPGGSCVVAVTFTPADIGPRTAELLFTDNGQTASQSTALSGTGESQIG